MTDNRVEKLADEENTLSEVTETVNYIRKFVECSQCPYHVSNHQGRGYPVLHLCNHERMSEKMPPDKQTGEIVVKAPEIETYPLIPSWCPLAANAAVEKYKAGQERVIKLGEKQHNTLPADASQRILDSPASQSVEGMEGLRKKVEAAVNDDDSCDRCADDDFKPADCPYFDPLFDKEDGHPDFCLKPESVDVIMDDVAALLNTEIEKARKEERERIVEILYKMEPHEIDTSISYSGKDEIRAALDNKEAGE